MARFFCFPFDVNLELLKYWTLLSQIATQERSWHGLGNSTNSAHVLILNTIMKYSDHSSNDSLQWRQWARAPTFKKQEDLILSPEVQPHVLSHMQLKRTRKSLDDDDDEGNEICLQMQRLRRMAVTAPVAEASYLAPPTLRRENRCLDLCCTEKHPP